MKNKRKLTIITLIVLNIIAYGAYLGLSHANKLSSSVDKSMYISSTKLGTVNKMSCTNSDGTFTFEKQNDKWTCPDVSGFRVNQDTVNDLAEKATNLTAERKVDSNGSLADYGLDSPQFKITLSDTDGKSVTYEIGNLNSEIRKYYVKTEGSKDVYAVKSNYGENIIRPLYAYSSVYDLSEIDKSSISKMTINDGKSDVVSIIQGEKDANSPLGSESQWKFDSVFPQDTNANTYKVDSLWTKLGEIASGNCTDFNVDSKKLEEYGLKNPEEKITVNYAIDNVNKSFTFSIGQEKEDGSAYVMFSDSNAIGLASVDDVKSFLDYTDPYNLLPQSVCAAKLNTLSGLTVTYDGQTYSYGIKTSGDKTSYTLNNVECNSDNFEAFFKKLSALDSQSNTTDGSSASESTNGSMVIIYHPLNTKYGDMKVVLSPYNSDYYIASFNNIKGRLVNKRSVESIANLLQNAK